SGPLLGIVRMARGDKHPAAVATDASEDEPAGDEDETGADGSGHPSGDKLSDTGRISILRDRR
ncbi:MAG: hypothetical protein AAFN78_07760, partial [Pseudomonadota bacterium]